MRRTSAADSFPASQVYGIAKVTDPAYFRCGQAFSLEYPGFNSGVVLVPARAEDTA